MNSWIIVRLVGNNSNILEVDYEFTPERTARKFSSAKAAADYANNNLGSENCFIAKLINPKDILSVNVHPIKK